jgi:hypothetical protein
MRHTTTAAAATVLLLALTMAGCGSNDSGDGKADSKPSPHASAQREDQYLADAKDIPFTSRRPTNAELLTYPPQWCQALDGGHSVKWMFSGGGGNLYPLGTGWGTVERDADRLLLAGVKAYCPDHAAAVTSELRAAGKY